MKAQKNNIEESDILSSPQYICQACTVITESLKEGGDVVQMPNGDIIIREQKTVITKFSWNSGKEKIVKLSTEIENPSNHSLNL
jgi:hypothetical protein